MEEQDNLNQDQNNLAGDVMDSIGEKNHSEESQHDNSTDENDHKNDSLAVQKRLKQQKRSHEREIRGLHSKIDELQSMIGRSPEPSMAMNQNAPSHSNVDDQIQKAVSYALQHKEMEERKAREAQSMAHIQKKYQDLNKHLDSASEKYDDFDDVVRGEDVPFTAHMRDAALMLPHKGSGSAAEVLYKLGKNPEELSRIAKLHPSDQAAEMVRLSHALIGGSDIKSTSADRPLGQIKSNPVTNSRSVTDRTPVSELRKRMKEGWK